MAGAQIEWSKVPWHTLIPRLLVFAHIRLRRARVSDASLGAQDVVHGAIEKTINGIRTWDPKRIGLAEHLMGVISSDVFNLGRKNRTQEVTQLSDEHIATIAGHEPSAEDQLAMKSEVVAILAALEARDPEIAALARLIIVEDILSADDQANALGTTTADIRNRKKRLNRAVGGLLAGSLSSVGNATDPHNERKP